MTETSRRMNERPLWDNVLVSCFRRMKVDPNDFSRTCGRLFSRLALCVDFQGSRCILTVSKMFMWCTPTTGKTPGSTLCSRAAGRHLPFPSFLQPTCKHDSDSTVIMTTVKALAWRPVSCILSLKLHKHKSLHHFRLWVIYPPYYKGSCLLPVPLLGQ